MVRLGKTEDEIAIRYQEDLARLETNKHFRKIVERETRDA